MRTYRKYLLTILTLLVSIAVIAQDTQCDVDQSQVVEVVDTVCSEMGQNRVCYGNEEVNAVPRADVLDFSFSTPGDDVDVVTIRSLYLSELNTDFDTWGIAKMRLLVNERTGFEEVNLLLFGDTSLETGELAPELAIVINPSSAANIRNTPAVNAPVIASLPAGTELTALGRLDDSSWVQVELPDGLIGWVFAALVSPADDADEIASLPVRSSQSRYWGPMQAFYIDNGTSSACGTQLLDGLLIQTPEGYARVTLFINEVSIDLIGGANGATALVNTNEANDMNIALLDGAAFVEAQGTGYFVDTYTQTSVALNDDLKPAAAPTVPNAADVDSLKNMPLLSLVRDMSLPYLPSTAELNDTGTSNTSGNTPTGDNTGGGDAQGGGNGGGNGGPPPCAERGKSCNAPGQNK